MVTDQKKDMALFKYSVISPLITTPEAYDSNNDFFMIASNKNYITSDGRTIKVSASTIERWYYAYKKNGFDGLLKQQRKDLGQHRIMTEELINDISEIVAKYPRMKAKDIYIQLQSKTNCSYDTVNRIYKQIKSQSMQYIPNKQMLRYELAYANDVWCADSSAGPYLYKEKDKIRLYIIAFIDDASRLITGCKIYENDNTINLMATLKSAIKLNGKPKVLNMDNGKNYRSRQMSIIAAKLGISLHYDPIKTPQSKAKIERFFRTLKDHWLASIDYHNFKSVEEYQKSLNDYIFKYNNTIHSSLNGKTPIERRDKDINLIKFESNEKLDKDFLFEIERTVSFDCIVMIDTKEYQTPAKFANKKKVKIKYAYDFTKAYIIDESGKEYELKLNNKVENSLIKRSRLTEDNL